MRTGAELRIDPNLAQYDLIFGAGAVPQICKDWRLLMPKFRNQGGKPLCGGYSLANAKYALDKDQLSDKVYNCDTVFFEGNGSKNGSYMPDLMAIVKDRGIPLEEDKPTLPANQFDWANWDKFKADSLALSEIAKSRRQIAKILGYSSVIPLYFADALNFSPVIIIIELYKSYTENYVLPPKEGEKPFSRHFVDIEWIDLNNGDVHIFDSVQFKAGFDGHKVLNKDYPIIVGYSMRDLPLEWRDITATKQKTEFWNCLAHYDMPRNYEAEVKIGFQMVKEFKKFKNDSVFAAASRFWTVYINAVCYGNYTYTDVINDCYNWRRTGKHIWDFNKIK